MQPFTLDAPTIEDIAQDLASLYERVDLSRDPMFSWVQVANDVTILGEDLRRDRRSDAIERAAKVLWRLLEFIGYYTYVRPIEGDEFADTVARLLRSPSATDFMPAGDPKEGPTRWILAKYPYACSKCGRRPCHCVLEPWVVEDRREKPQEYEDFKDKADKARQDLMSLSKRPPLTLKALLHHFQGIYRNSHHHQDPWKIGMHLSEEVGEATIELGRINLGWRAQRMGFNLQAELDETFKIAKRKLENETSRIKNKKIQSKRLAELNKDFAKLKEQVAEHPWPTYERLVGDKFKEEVSDVFSWLAAIILKLDPSLRTLKGLPRAFLRPAGKGTEGQLGCPWCTEPKCQNKCLVRHALSSEMSEKVSKF